MSFLGIGEISGSLINGYLLDSLGTKRVMILNIGQLILAYAVLLTYTA